MKQKLLPLLIAAALAGCGGGNANPALASFVPRAPGSALKTDVPTASPAPNPVPTASPTFAPTPGGGNNSGGGGRPPANPSASPTATASLSPTPIFTNSPSAPPSASPTASAAPSASVNPSLSPVPVAGPAVPYASKQGTEWLNRVRQAERRARSGLLSFTASAAETADLSDARWGATMTQRLQNAINHPGIRRINIPAGRHIIGQIRLAGVQNKIISGRGINTVLVFNKSAGDAAILIPSNGKTHHVHLRNFVLDMQWRPGHHRLEPHGTVL